LFYFFEEEIQRAIIKQGKLDIYKGINTENKLTLKHLKGQFKVYEDLKCYVQDLLNGAVELEQPTGTNTGYIDILAKRGINEIYIIELKKGVGIKSDLEQLLQYSKLFEDNISRIRNHQKKGSIQVKGNPFSIPLKPKIHGVLAALDFFDGQNTANRPQYYMANFVKEHIDLAYIDIETYKGKRAIKRVSLVLYKDF